MEIRYASKKDTLSVVRSLQNKKIDYNTTKQAKEDIANNRMIVVVDNNKIVASCALVEEPTYNYTAIKRLCVFNNKNRRKGYGSALMNYVCSLGIKNLGATPWNNTGAIRLFEKFGFKYQYTFLENYNFYLKKA